MKRQVGAMMKRAVLALTALAAPMLVGAPTQAGSDLAGTLARPAGAVMLTVKGAIARTNGGGVALFDREMLEALPRSTMQTWTPWTRGRPVFEGVAFSDLMAAVAAEGDRIRAEALNDYTFEFSVADALADGAIIADRMDGQALTVRTKGPLWVIFPIERYDGVARDEIGNRMVWQLTEIEIQ